MNKPVFLILSVIEVGEQADSTEEHIIALKKHLETSAFANLDIKVIGVTVSLISGKE